MDQSQKPLESNGTLTSESFNAGQREILERIADGAPLHELLERIVLLVEQQASGMICSLLLLDRERKVVRHGAAPSLPAEFCRAIDGQPIGPQAGSCGTAAFLRERVIVEDIATHPYWGQYKDFALPFGLRACWSSPIYSPGRDVLGTFAMYYREPRRPAEVEIRWVDAATHLAAIAIRRDEAEQALRRSEERYRQIVDSAFEGVWLIDTEARTLFVNRRMEEMLGYERDEMTGRSMYDFMDEAGRIEAAPRLARRMSGVTEQHEFRLRRKDGSDCWTIIAANPLANAQGEITGALGMLTDITERKEAETALRTSEERLRAMTDNTPNVAIQWYDAQGRIRFWNRASEASYGWSQAEALGRTLGDLIFSPDEMAKFLECIATIQRTGEPCGPLEFSLRRRDGSEGWCLSTIFRIPASEQEDYFVCMDVDLTARRKAEEALRARERQLAFVHDHVLDIIFHLSVEPDGQFRFASVNRSFLAATGLEEGQVIGRPVQEVIPAASLAAVLANYRRAIAGRETVRWEEVSAYPAGVKIGEVSITPLFDEEGRCHHLIGTVHDITELKQAERELRELTARLLHAQEDERRRIAKELHDSTAQDLAALAMNIGTVRQRLAGNDAGADRMLEDSLALIEQSVRDLRTLAYLLHPPMLDELGLDGALRQYAEGFSQRSGIRTTVEIAPGGERLSAAVEAALFRVAQESLGNVRRHSQSPVATIRLARSPGEVVLEISDEGTGLPRGAAGEKGAAPGVGIAGMHERLRQLGGRLVLESNGHGTAVRAVLPLAGGTT